MKKPLLIYGGGGLGRELLSFVRGVDEWQVAGFLDDVLPTGTVMQGIEVKGNIDFLQRMQEPVYVILAIGDPKAKYTLRQKITNKFVKFPVVVHPSVVLQNRESIRLGEGTVICAGAVLTTDINIGTHVLINLNVTIGHDCSIGDFSSIMPGANVSGQVQMDTAVFIGSGTNIRNKTRVGSKSVVGMGSVVIKDVMKNTTVAGVPAIEIRS